ncbi:hypothetical protein DFJ58DRAFT_733640 [Suillus subalutaceus]|uniref:uncharacterized protein n=1 Tax=Suillus subalutaceus TaxID=48586 RepID=UPI001B88022C|nr:uncharacterized protein DFJ58DRAFT_733640 [Suillus subalutaceus]KAG1838817.1 hypothetical protein DFJ58DRAFT_733640 [Suillus subalutaceus]
MGQWYHETVLEAWEILVLNKSEADRASSIQSFVKDVAILFLLHTVLAYPFLPFHARFSNAFRRPFIPARKSSKGSGATRRPPIQARRISPGFFDGSSAARGTHTLSPAHSACLSPPIPRALLERLSSFFHHSHFNANGAPKLHQCPSRSIFSRGHCIVEVATVQDRKALYVAPRPQQQSQSHVQALSQSQPTATASSMSTTPVQGTCAAAQSPPIPLLTCFVLFICCASPSSI